jgi:putative oxidoreductase
MSIRRKLIDSSGPAAVILIRLIVGAVFLAEGVQKFLLPNDLGVGRFAKISIPAPQVMAPFVGAVEAICGTLILFGNANLRDLSADCWLRLLVH